jgi:uncharacterized protein (DUF433 family)
MMGKPVVAGTRITVELLLEKLGAGDTIDDLLLDYPQLTRESIQAALRFAAQVLAGSPPLRDNGPAQPLERITESAS